MAEELKIAIVELKKDVGFIKEKVNDIHFEVKKTNGRVTVNEKAITKLFEDIGDINRDKKYAIENKKNLISFWQAIIVAVIAFFSAWAGTGFRTPWS